MTFFINPMNKNHKQDDFKMLGVFDIFKESIRLIMTNPKIFIQITLVSIFPPSCIFLVDDWSSMFKLCDMSTLGHNQAGTSWYNNISGSISRELVTCLLIQAAFYISSVICSFISISTIVYTISCIYAGQEITFRKAMSVIPKVWKRYMVTFVCETCASFAITFIPVIWAMLFIIVYGKLGKIALVIEILLLVVCTLYMGISWQLVDAISVMEKTCGFRALKRSRALIKGKVGIAFAIFFVALLCEIPILLPKYDEQLVQVGVEIGVGETIWYRILSVVWSSLVSLFVLVTKSVFYFVCKAYHNEEIDKSILSEHVDEYHGEYVSLKSEII